jgi:hypothetical protein
MNTILVKTRHPRDRYRIISGSMGNYRTVTNHANNRFQIVEGIDRGNGYQGYMSVSYFLTLDYVPKEAKDRVISICKEHNLVYSD